MGLGNLEGVVLPAARGGGADVLTVHLDVGFHTIRCRAVAVLDHNRAHGEVEGGKLYARSVAAEDDEAERGVVINVTATGHFQVERVSAVADGGVGSDAERGCRAVVGGPDAPFFVGLTEVDGHFLCKTHTRNQGCKKE